MVGRISVLNSRELQATLLAIRVVDKTTQAQIRKATKTISLPEWLRALAAHATTRLENRVLVSTARVAVSNQNVRLSSATVGRPLEGGLQPQTGWRGVELGSKHKKQFRGRNLKGYVFYPAVADIVPRIAALWVQTVVRTLHEAFEGKS